MTSKILKPFLSGAAALSLLALGGCEKVIDIELNEADRRYVIEGAVYEGGIL